MSIQLFTTIMNLIPNGYYFDRLEQAQQFYTEAIENDVDMPKAKIRQYAADMFDVDKSDI